MLFALGGLWVTLLAFGLRGMHGLRMWPYMPRLLSILRVLREQSVPAVYSAAERTIDLMLPVTGPGADPRVARADAEGRLTLGAGLEDFMEELLAFPGLEYASWQTGPSPQAAPTAVAEVRLPVPALRRRLLRTRRRGPVQLAAPAAGWSLAAGTDYEDLVELLDAAFAGLTFEEAAARLDAPFVAIGATRAPHGATVAPRHLQTTGPLPEAELAGWLSRRPVFASAARFEPFGLAVLEAAQAGCPLVLSDIPTFRELWDGAATFVAAGDAEGFAIAIAALLADPARHAVNGAAAQARAARYTPAATAAGMTAIYRDLLAARKDAA